MNFDIILSSREPAVDLQMEVTRVDQYDGRSTVKKKTSQYRTFYSILMTNGFHQIRVGSKVFNSMFQVLTMHWNLPTEQLRTMGPFVNVMFCPGF